MLRRIGALVVSGVVAVCLAQATFAQRSQEDVNSEQRAINVEMRITVSDIERRLAEVERANSTTRLSLLENDMVEIKWIARGAATAIVGQILFVTFAKPYRRRRSEDRWEEKDGDENEDRR